MAIDLDAPIRFLRTAFHPDDWVAVLLKSHETGGTAQRVGPLSLIASAKFQAWLRAQSARRFSVFVSVNTIRPQRKARTRDAIGEIRHVFLDADRDGPAVLAAIAARRDLPPPSCVVHSSPNRLHVLWRASGFTKESVEALQKQMAQGTRNRQGGDILRAGHATPGILQPQVPARADGNRRICSGRARLRAARLPASAGDDRPRCDGASNAASRTPIGRPRTCAEVPRLDSARCCG